MANGSKDSDDDFESTSPLLSQNLIRRNQKIPAGHLLAALKWRTTNVVEKLKGNVYYFNFFITLCHYILIYYILFI